MLRSPCYIWAGKEARTYLNMVDEDKKESLKAMLDTLEAEPSSSLIKLQHSHSSEP